MAARGDGRPDPDLLLRQVQAEESRARRGRLKVFLGYSSGVGKTFTMLDEGRRRLARGQDVIVGAIQPKRSEETDALLEALEVIPLLQGDGRPCMDTAAILRRRPQVCLVDGLAWENPPGVRHRQRWQDIEELLEAGISVIGTINLQYVAEYQQQVQFITGKLVRETVPLDFIHRADEIEIVDAPAIAASGDDDVSRREQQLRELRELALLATADVVDRQLEAYLGQAGVPLQWGMQERILVCLTARSDAAAMITSGERNANRFHGELMAVYVRQDGLTEPDRQQLDANLRRARDAGAKVDVVLGSDPIAAILQYARSHGVTQIYIGHSKRTGWRNRLFGSPVDRLIRLAEGMDVQVFPN